MFKFLDCTPCGLYYPAVQIRIELLFKKIVKTLHLTGLDVLFSYMALSKTLPLRQVSFLCDVVAKYRSIVTNYNGFRKSRSSAETVIINF